MMNIPGKMIAILLLLMGTTVHAQQEITFKEGIVGQWEGQGTLFGTDAAFKMHWTTTLNDKFVKLSFQNQFVEKSGTTRVMKASAFYNLEKKEGYWFDSRGLMLPLKLEPAAQSLTVWWGDESTEQGKTVYTLLGKKRLNVEDYVLKDNSYMSFGKAQYQKSSVEQGQN
ncbi:hypothetical protein WIW50_19735 [Flavobacteriaceae bacterium 3-367]